MKLRGRKEKPKLLRHELLRYQIRRHKYSNLARHFHCEINFMELLNEKKFHFINSESAKEMNFDDNDVLYNTVYALFLAQ